MNTTLTPAQANLIKDILKVIGNDDELNMKMAQAVGMDDDSFNDLADEIFDACQNGRLTVVES